MSEYKMSVRQICFIIIGFFMSTKMIFAAAITAGQSGKSLWISAIINFVLDGTFIFIILLIGERFKNKDFFEILSGGIGKIPSKIIYFLLSVLLIIKAYVPIMEQRNFIEISLYETLPTILTFLPFFLFCGYFSYKGLKAVARCSDILVWFTLIAIIGLITLTLPNADFSELLPIFKGISAKKIIAGSYKSGIWYFDSVYFLFFIGRYNEQKLGKTKIMSAFFLSVLLICLYFITIYAEFGVLTERQYFAPSKMGLFAVALLNIGRIDYLFSILLCISNVFAISLPLLFSTLSLNNAFNFKNKASAAIIVNSIMFICVFLSRDIFFEIFNIFQNLYVIFLCFMCGIILIMPLLKMRKKI